MGESEGGMKGVVWCELDCFIVMLYVLCVVVGFCIVEYKCVDLCGYEWCVWCWWCLVEQCLCGCVVYVVLVCVYFVM